MFLTCKSVYFATWVIRVCTYSLARDLFGLEERPSSGPTWLFLTWSCSLVAS